MRWSRELRSLGTVSVSRRLLKAREAALALAILDSRKVHLNSTYFNIRRFRREIDSESEQFLEST